MLHIHIAVLIGVVIGWLLPCDATANRSRVTAEFSEDGRVVVVQTAGGLAVWNIETKALVGKVPQIQCDQVRLLKQDSWVLCAGNGVTIYDWTRSAVMFAIPPEAKQPMRVLAYSPEADRIVVRQGNDAVSVWHIGDKLTPLKHIPLYAEKDVSSVAASPDTKKLAVTQGRKILLYDLYGTAVRDVVTKEGQPRELCFAPNGSILAAGIGNTILLIDTEQRTIHARATLGDEEGARSRLTPRRFSLDSSRLVAGNGQSSYPVFEVETGKLLALTELISADRERGARSKTQPHTVDISDDVDYLVGQPEQSSALQIWDLRTGSMVSDLCGEDCRNMGLHVSLLKWSPDGSKILVEMNGGRNAEVNGKISLWDVTTRAPELVLDPSQPQAKILAKRAPPSARTAASSALPAGSAFVHALALRTMATSPTTNLLVTAGDEGMLKVWNPGKGTLLRRLKLTAPASALAFSADGTILATGTTQGEIRLWETLTWREFSPYASRQGHITALQFLPGNRLLAVAGEQPKVTVVDLATREVVKELIHKNSSETCDEEKCIGKRATQEEVVLTLALLDGSPFLLTASQTERVVWNIETWTEIDKPAGFPENWSALGWRRLFLATTARTRSPNAFALTVWDTRRNGPVAGLDTFTHEDTQVTEKGAPMELGVSLAVDPLNRWAATRVGERISVWDLQEQARKTTFSVKMPYYLHWTGDGKHLIISTLDRKILVWSAERMEPAHFLLDPSVTQ
jgi:WD40 repeat protein